MMLMICRDSRNTQTRGSELGEEATSLVGRMLGAMLIFS